MFYRIIYISVDDPAGVTEYVTQKGRVTGEWWIKMDLMEAVVTYEGWNFNSGNYLFTTDTK